MIAAFSSTVGPAGLTFIGPNGCTFQVPTSHAVYPGVRDLLKARTAAVQGGNIADAERIWNEMAVLARKVRADRIAVTRETAPASATVVPVAAPKRASKPRPVPSDPRPTTKVSSEQINHRKFLIAMRHLEQTSRQSAYSGGPKAQLRTFMLNSSIETAHQKRSLDSAQLATLRQAYEAEYTWDLGQPLTAEPNDVPVPKVEKAVIQLREDFGRHQVRVLANGKEVNRFNDYKPAAEFARRRYNLDDADLMNIYHDYKADYDAA